MNQAEEQIRALVDAETAAWNACDANALADLFHPDTVWPWPPNAGAHDPMQWVMPLGRYDRDRWARSWQELFNSHELVHNQRRTLGIAAAHWFDGFGFLVNVRQPMKIDGAPVPLDPSKPAMLTFYVGFPQSGVPIDRQTSEARGILFGTVNCRGDRVGAVPLRSRGALSGKCWKS